MKINHFTGALAIFIAGLFTFYISYYTTEKNSLFVLAGSFISTSLTLLGITSITAEDGRKNLSIKLIASCFFVITIFSQFLFLSLSEIIIQTYAFITLGTLSIYILILYFLFKADLK
jgi:hypothetical protein